MYDFSEEFLNGLNTKSENFQNEFYYVVDQLCAYNRRDRQLIQAMLENELSYDKPGNIINYMETFWGGDPHDKTAEEWKKEMGKTVLDLFAEEEWGEYHGLDIATHIFIAVHLPEDCFPASSRQMLQVLTMMQRPSDPPFVYVANDPTADTAYGCFIAILK